MQVTGVIVGTRDVVPISNNNGSVTVTNAGTGTLYWNDSNEVSSTVNRGSLGPGSTRTFTIPIWVIQSVAGAVTLQIVDGDVAATLNVVNPLTQLQGLQSGTTPVVTLEPVPTYLNNAWQGINGGPVLVQGGTVANGYEYLLVNRDNNQPSIYQRPVGAVNWTGPTDLSGIFGTTGLDGHNFYALGVDTKGYVHISGNMHSVALKYARSTAPNSIAAFTSPGMTGVNEANTTYPQFLALPNGQLGFFYRNGASGDGNAYLKSYDPVAQVWTDKGEILDGTSTSDSPYCSDLVHSQDGQRIGICYSWRKSPVADTAQNLCFIQSSDGGTTWTDVTGKALSLPLTRNTSPIAFATAAADTGLITTNMDWDSNGIPHLTTLLWDSTGATNVLHVYWTGLAWASEFVTSGTWRMAMNHYTAGVSLIDDSIGRPGVICNAQGDTYVIWRSIKDGKRETIRIIDITRPGQPNEFTLAAIDVGYGNQLHFDVDTVRKTGIAKMFINNQPTGANANDPIAYGDVLNWGTQWGALMSVDLTRVRQMTAFAGRVRMRPLITTTLPVGANPTIASTTAADVTSSPQVTVDPAWAGNGWMVMVKLSGTLSKATAGTGTVYVIARTPGGSAVNIGSLTSSVVGSAQTLATPWIPVNLGSLQSGGLLSLQFKSSDTNVLTLSSATLQVAAIEGSDGKLIGSRFPVTAYNTPLSSEDSFLQNLISAPILFDWDVNAITGQTNGNPIVSPWLTDRGPNGIVASQSGALAVPTYNTGVVNGKAALTFAGAQVLAWPGSSSYGGGNFPYTFTVIAVCKSTAAGVQEILCADDGSTLAGRVLQFRYGSATDLDGIGFGNNSGTPNAVTCSQTLTATNFNVVTMIKSAYGVQTRVNGVPATLVSTTFDPSAGVTNKYFLGAQAFSGSISSPLTGSIARLIAMGDVMVLAELQQIERGLGTLYGITVA